MAKSNPIKSDDLPIVNLVALADQRRTNPKAAWRRARELDSKQFAELSTPEDILTLTRKLENPRDRCLLVILYICGSRVGEVVRKKVVKYGRKEVYLIRKNKRGRGSVPDYTKKRVLRVFPSLKREDIVIQEVKGRKVLVIRTRNEKNKRPKSQLKQIPLPLDNETNLQFKRVIDIYIAGLYDEEELFQFEERRAQQILEKVGINPHYFRELRLTHLAKYNDFTDQQLVAFAGWSDSRPAKHYIKMRWEDLISKM